MKVSKIPGLGSFGVFIDDVDLNNISNDQWIEIGKIHLQSLVTIIRNTKLYNTEKYTSLMDLWGTHQSNAIYNLYKKYNLSGQELFVEYNNPKHGITDSDKEYIKTVMNMMADNYVLRVSGKKDPEGNPIGMFAEGELLWHSNESGNVSFAPGVSLLGAEHMTKSSTGFATTVDWYEEQSESFRSELDDMIVVHNFTPGKINPGLNAQQDHVMYRNMCPEDGVEIPLVRQSPGGFRGIHYSQNTVSHINGMTESESNKIFKVIEQGIFKDDNVYDHWYKSDSDLCIFDNSITQHRRLGDTTNRLAYRIQFNYDRLIDTEYNPYSQEPYKSQFQTNKVKVNKLLRQHGI